MVANTLSHDITSHPVTTYLSSLTTRSSKSTMLSALRCALTLAAGEEVDEQAVWSFPFHAIEPAQLENLGSALAAAYSPAHASKVFSAVRSVLVRCAQAEMIEPGRWMLLQLVKGPRVSQDDGNLAGREIKQLEIDALSRVCATRAHDPAGARDNAIFALAWATGPRVSEISKLDLSDYDQATGDLTIRRAKGGKTRTIRIAGSAKAALDDWIYRWRGDDKPGPLFVPVNKGGRLAIGAMFDSPKRISSGSLAKMLKRRCAEAGIEPCTWHDFRRTWATAAWRSKTISGPNIQRLMGHSQISTSAQYNRAPLDEALAEGISVNLYPNHR